MDGELEFRELDEHHWPAAQRLIAGAFLDEPFVLGMFGDSHLDRFLGLLDLHAQWPSAPGEVVLGAWRNGVLLAVGTVTLPGSCAHCDRWVDEVTDESGPSDLDLEFRRGVCAGHLAAHLPEHAHITTVASEAALRGGGIGAALMTEICRRLGADGPVTVVLECYATRGRFYEQFGFRRIGEVPEAAVPGLMVALMRADIG